ncbi:NAD-dependent protein deacylase [compost metagenome]
MRPGVVWFGEMLPEQALQQAFAAAESCDLLLSIGTSGVVYPAAHVPQLALDSGAVVAHINQQAFAPSRPHEHSLLGPAGELLPALLQRAGWRAAPAATGRGTGDD